ncbi:hypothetical protein THASP1DRAFT_30369 [Thamnocephalis sphaerospora]|uniref:Protein kinase domain-containing protein n=1 Tax=Thamnocephalis sphaerospora TaxID=78915 RepID=A0A4P9XP99_9FUNG|nr:hypothetical protein THASP1DRAFT_30369 [Thamnocephalis sphaerospora]|eukprot:RKP07823.1 hypothetical protein THASP1DRAFT_30369 [Thamnocephalis sphaerospora]
MDVYFAVHLAKIRNSHVKERETELAKGWKYEEQMAAIQACIGNTWGNRNSFFIAIHLRCPEPLPGEGMADEVYGTVFTRRNVMRDPIIADLDLNNISRYLDPKRFPSDTRPYILSLLKKLKQARTCVNINQGCYADFFASGHYVRAIDTNPNGEGSSSRNEMVHDELPPFHAGEKELWLVHSYIEQLRGHNFFELDRPTDFQMNSGAAYRQEDDSQKRTYGLDVKPDFRFSIMIDALLGQEIRMIGEYPDNILEREVCFMQSEIKKSTDNRKGIRAKFYLQMVDAICRQEALLYGYTPKGKIDDKRCAPFCVGSFVHGLEIEFYLCVSAHPDQNRRGYAIYLYKTVNLSPANDGVIDSTSYIEASVAFCNQIDLVLERLEHDHTGLKSGDRDAKRQMLNEISRKAESEVRSAKRRRGNEDQGDNGGAGNGSNNTVAYGSRGHVNCVWRTLENANVLKRDSFKSLFFEAQFSKRCSTDTCNDTNNTDFESDTDEEQLFESPSWMARAISPGGQKIFIKVFKDTCFGEHEIWMNKLILRAAKLRNNMQITPQYGQLDGRVTKIVWTGECDGYPILVMNTEQEAKRPISTPMQLAKFAQYVATTLAMLHEDFKVVHGDIKPDNLIVVKNDGDGQPVRVVICDFGSAHPIEDDVELNTPIYPTGGTKGYCAPESSARNSTPASDNQSIKCEAMYVLMTKMMDPVPKKRPHARDVIKEANSIQQTLKTLGRDTAGVSRKAHTITFEPMGSTVLHSGGSGVLHRSGPQDAEKPPQRRCGAT